MSTGCVYLHPIGRNISKNRKTYLKKEICKRKKIFCVYQNKNGMSNVHATYHEGRASIERLFSGIRVLCILLGI
jgi:hypothetical protein